MGRNLADNFDVARRTFEEADDALGFSISKLCFDGPEEQLKLTEFQQPAICTVSVAALRVLAERGIAPALASGAGGLGRIRGRTRRRIGRRNCIRRLRHKREARGRSQTPRSSLTSH